MEVSVCAGIIGIVSTASETEYSHGSMRSIEKMQNADRRTKVNNRGQIVNAINQRQSRRLTEPSPKYTKKLETVRAWSTKFHTACLSMWVLTSSLVRT